MYFAKKTIAAAAALFASAAMSQSLLYGTVGSGGQVSTLVRIDPATGALVSSIGSVGYGINGLTYDPVSRTIYATTTTNDPNFANGLISVDPTTGAGTRIGIGSGLSLVNVVTAAGNGTVYGWTEDSDDLVVWNTAAGTATVVGDSGLSTYEQSLAFDKKTGVLYLINGNGNIYTVNTATGVPTQVGSLSAPTVAHHGDVSSDGRVYAIDATGRTNPRNLVIIDPTTGEVISTLATVDSIHALAFVSDLGPSAVDTLQALRANAFGLRRIFALQASTVNPGLSYDCTTFDAKGICVGFTGRQTNTSGNGADATSGVLIAGYKVNPRLRIGGYIEQRFGTVSADGVRVDSNTPDLGLFAAWSEKANGEGLQVRAAHRFGKKNVTITRPVVGTSEAGSGTSDLKTQGTQLTVSRGYALNSTWKVSPYAGLRHVLIERKGYTEAANITTPLTYGTLRQESISALLGASFAGQVAPKVTLSAGLGIEHDVKRRTSDYSATGVSDLGSFNFNDNPNRTRPLASVGVTYSIDKTKQLGAQVIYRKEAFPSTSTTTALISLTAGF